MTARPHYALRFISGKYQGGEFPLHAQREIIIGRSSDLDMVLVEDMVSRKHARISTTDTDVFIEDLGSTNGTFVNGEKVQRSQLNEGDRILVGTSIIKMVEIDPNQTPASEAEARRRMEAGAQNRAPSVVGRPMSGVIEEIPLPDLLQLLSTSRKSGALSITNRTSVGRIYLRQGQLYFASIDENFGVAPEKAIYRMLRWKEGTFELEPGVEINSMEEIQNSTEGLLMEGCRQIDEFDHLSRALPDPQSPLAIPTPIQGKLRDLSPEELDVFQLVLDHGSVQSALDNFTGSDLDCAKALVDLIKKEFILAT